MPPKSLDRNDFNLDAVKHMNIQNGAATLAAFTAAAIEDAERFFPRPVTKWYIAGGGRHNTAVMESLQERLEHVEPVDVLGWEGDALEAQAFAYLAMRSINGLELTLPNTTGVNRAVTGGAFYQV
jgi:anhydro-N-acetylmuramic acid kinase